MTGSRVLPKRHPIGLLEFGTPRHRLAPGPRGTALGGSLPALRHDGLSSLIDGANRYGDVVRFVFGPRIAHLTEYLIRDPEHIHYVLFEARESYVKSYQYKLMGRALGEGLITSDGALWARQRRLVQPGFRHSQVLALAGTMIEASSEVSRTWRELAVEGKPVDMAGEMMRLTLDTVGRTLLSSDLADEVGSISPAVGFLEQDMVERMSSVSGFASLLSPQIPTPANRRMLAALRTLDSAVNGLIARRRALPESERPADLLSMLMAARDAETGRSMDDRQIRDEVMTLFVAGHETTANALSWTWYLLSTHTLVARRLREELRSVLAGRDLAPEDVEKLAYTKAVVEEAMRLYPPVAAITREALHDDEIGGFHIPARTTVMISPWVSHRNPRFWPAPEAFDPDRFLPGSVERPRLAYLPFGAGPRQCLGTGFALQEMVIALGVLAARFDPALVPGQRVEPQFGVSVRPRYGVSMTIHDAE
jgi:cytochrome P450